MNCVVLSDTPGLGINRDFVVLTVALAVLLMIADDSSCDML